MVKTKAQTLFREVKCTVASNTYSLALVQYKPDSYIYIGRIDNLEHDIRVADRKREKANEEKGIELK